MIRLVREAINAASLMEELGSPRAGAVVTFDGRVRDHSHGKSVTHLFYEAYEPMARSELETIEAEARASWPLEEVVIVHRLGRMEIGESSVFIAVSCAHRAEAFEACRHIIDRIKVTVPIWKKEFSADGEAWVEGP